MIQAMLLMGCVSTELSQPAPSGACVSQRRPADSVPAVRGVIVSFDSGSRWCSAVVIAPSLVLTGLGCITSPVAEEEVSAAMLQVESGEAVTFSMAGYRELCNADAGWAPLERGTFESRLGGVLDGSSILLDVGSDLPPPVIDDVFTSRSTSLCADDLAILLMAEPLDVERVPLRLSAHTEPGEPVVMRGFCNSGGTTVPWDLESSVALVTGERPEVSAPPRSLVLSAQASKISSGGAVFSEQTGALIATITTGRGITCNDVEGDTVALQLAPFRRLLLEAAGAAEEELLVEPSPDALPAFRACESN